MIFSMFLTDLRRSSISRRVAMLRAWEGAAPSAVGWDAIRPSVRRASMIGNEKMKEWWRSLCVLSTSTSGIGGIGMRVYAELIMFSGPCEVMRIY